MEDGTCAKRSRRKRQRGSERGGQLRLRCVLCSFMFVNNHVAIFNVIDNCFCSPHACQILHRLASSQAAHADSEAGGCGKGGLQRWRRRGVDDSKANTNSVFLGRASCPPKPLQIAVPVKQSATVRTRGCRRAATGPEPPLHLTQATRDSPSAMPSPLRSTASPWSVAPRTAAGGDRKACPAEPLAGRKRELFHLGKARTPDGQSQDCG